MNKRTLFFGGSVIVLVIVAIGLSISSQYITQRATPRSTTDTAPRTAPVEAQLPDGKSNLQFELFAPTEGSTIKSPLELSGRARGTWFFEASFPIELRDADGHTIATIPAHADADWMTEDFVDWSAHMTWSATSTTATSGVLVFKKDNPSGLPEHDASVVVPILFK